MIGTAGQVVALAGADIEAAVVPVAESDTEAVAEAVAEVDTEAVVVVGIVVAVAVVAGPLELERLEIVDLECKQQRKGACKLEYIAVDQKFVQVDFGILVGVDTAAVVAVAAEAAFEAMLVAVALVAAVAEIQVVVGIVLAAFGSRVEAGTEVVVGTQAVVDTAFVGIVVAVTVSVPVVPRKMTNTVACKLRRILVVVVVAVALLEWGSELLALMDMYQTC